MEATISYKFEVSNINDERMTVSKGTMEISRTHLIHTTHGSSKRRTTWPLRHLRRFGCSGNIFCFEAGRQCSLGEGLYAFQCSRASELLQVVNVMLRSIEPDHQSVPPTAAAPRPPLRQQNSHPPLLPRERVKYETLCQDEGYDVVWDINKMRQLNKAASSPSSL